MNQINWTSFIVFSTVLALVIQILIINPVLAQGLNATSAENRSNTRLVVNLKNQTMSIVDTISNQTISVKNLTKPTTNETNKMTIPDKLGNATTNETNKMISSGKSGNSGNLGNNENLSERLGKLAK